MSRPSRRCEPVPLEIRETASLLERRWQLSILYAALTGALRFNEFADAVAGISPRMLSERLRDLEAAGLVQRTVLPTSPPTVEYRLTDRGRRLSPLIEAMREYARS
jgi:DNA-binding HxlR family transcriptional regulator